MSMIPINKNELQFALDGSNSEGNKVINMVYETIIVRGSERISIAGKVRLIKYPYNGINSV